MSAMDLPTDPIVALGDRHRDYDQGRKHKQRQACALPQRDGDEPDLSDSEEVAMENASEQLDAAAHIDRVA